MIFKRHEHFNIQVLVNLISILITNGVQSIFVDSVHRLVSSTRSLVYSAYSIWILQAKFKMFSTFYNELFDYQNQVCSCWNGHHL